MVKYISKKWNKILIFIGLCFMVFILYAKITAPKTIIPDYIKYGKDVESIKIPESASGVIDSAKDIAGTAKNEFVSTWNNTDPALIKFFVIIGGAILIIVFLDSFASMLGRKKEEKKKK